MYRVSLDTFEGPMDLLLFFIRRDELDIYDIPIARIADEYLAYVRVLEQVDLDRAGDFIYVAALLISIKAKMLLPRNEEEGEGGEEIDPRQELVERLLEYLRYKEATQALDEFHRRRLERYTRPPEALAELLPQVEQEDWANASVFDLVSALRRVLTEAPPEPVHAVRRLEYTVEAQLDYVAEELRLHRRIGFVTLAGGHPKSFIIATFLAVLELARRGEAIILVADEPEDFFVAAPADQPGRDDSRSVKYDAAA